MLTLVVVTAAVLALILVVGLVAILVFVTQIRGFIGETSAALDAVDEGATRLARRFEGVQQATAAAASELSASRT